MQTIYTNKSFKIIKMPTGFIVLNTDREFKKAHTHQNSFYICKVIIYCAIHGEFPEKAKHLSKNKRVLESILRVCPRRYVHIFNDYLSKI